MKKLLITSLFIMLIIACSEKKVEQENLVSTSEMTSAKKEAQKAKEEKERQAAEAQRKADEAERIAAE